MWNSVSTMNIFQAIRPVIRLKNFDKEISFRLAMSELDQCARSAVAAIM